ncbi:MAG: hypothetical protein IJ298_06505 [Ruminococcus sp.]|nr:hypothetical protein [Ruminococcus sp.]
MKNVKTLLALVMVMLMLVSLVACDDGGKNDPTDAPKVSVDGETIETTLWKLTYDSKVWKIDEDEFSDEDDYSKIILIIPDGDGYLINAEIRASVEDAEGFRDNLTYYDFDQYEYAVNNAYELTKVGGVDCVKHEGEYWGEPCVRYFGRDEGAGTTVFVEIIGDYEDANVQTLLAGLEFTLTDTGNTDAPWYWEGEAFSAEDKAFGVGVFSVNSKWIPFGECVIANETFDHAVAVTGNTAYIAGDGAVKQYAFDGETLEYVKNLDLDGDYSHINATDDGSVWISGFGEDLVCLKDGVQTAAYDGTDYVTMHPSGTWGISWFSGSECEKITISGDTITTEAITFAEVDTISTVIIDKDNIYVTGNAADDSGHKVFVYNQNGTLQKTLADEEGESLGSITFMAKIPQGYIGLDGNMREVVFWDNTGAFAGYADDDELFSTNYPWFCGGTLLSDGSILTVMTEERADESAMELIAFTLSGF